MTDRKTNSLPCELILEVSEIEWLEPWWCFYLEETELGQSFEDELRKEASDKHTLYVNAGVKTHHWPE